MPANTSPSRSRDRRTDTQVTLADVGYGINQILPVIIEGVASRENSILCVEQPEIHLHPRLQANIADLMIETIADGRDKRKQWIVETHSELLITPDTALASAQGESLPHPTVSVLYVDPDDRKTCEGSCDYSSLRLDENGDIGIDELASTASLTTRYKRDHGCARSSAASGRLSARYQMSRKG